MNETIETTYTTPDTESPKARILNLGPQALSIAELVSLVTGKKEPVDIAAEGLRPLAQMSPRQIADTHKIGLPVSVKVAAALELGKRMAAEGDRRKTRLDAPEAVAAYLAPKYADSFNEAFGFLALDSKHGLLGEGVVATGGRHSVGVTPADVFRAALPFGPRSIVVFHNHPSGDPNPSEEDKALTYRLCRAGEAVGIAVVDHIVLGGRSFASFKQLGLI